VATQGPVRHWTDGGIAVIEIDRPPVNALAHLVRVALLQAILDTDADPGVKAIVIHGAGPHFIAGSYLREFDAEPLQPLLNDVLLRLEACSKPVVAAAGAELLATGIAASSSDIDAIWCNGYGFPRYRGGPMFYADTLGPEAVTSQIESLARRWGVRDWTPSDKLRQLVARGQNFAEADEVTHD
jgi:hypothetical protein